MNTDQCRRWWITLLVGSVLCSPRIHAQCITSISTFPYNEGFEAAPAWISGGTNNDWAWGVPAHPSINGAAEGTKAWCVGGLTGSFYSNNQQSWLETPCFDLSLLNRPFLAFSIYWETEPNYDGIGLQYSPNGGVTWVNVGGVGDADCLTTNWFNSANITALNLASPRQGWSGTAVNGGCANGGGSGDWVTAAHCLDDLPTNAPVKFRFVFGAGSICNTFDGVAIDNVYIGEAPTLDPGITFLCAGNTVNFTNTASLCPASSAWSFGDPASGAGNAANGALASHTFSGPGTYTVSLTMAASCAEPQSVTTEVTIAGLEVVTTDVGCVPNSGTATANITGSNGPFTYSWSPGNGATQTIDDLAPGDYTVLVQATGMCPVQGTGTVAAGSGALGTVVEHTDVTCAGLANGTAAVEVSGGSGNYTFAWAPVGGSAASATGLAAGNYTCSVADDQGCTVDVQVTVSEPDALLLTTSEDAVICAGGNMTLSADGVGGTPPYSVIWSTEGPEVAPLQTTAYVVTVTDANGCTSAEGSILIDVVEPIVPSFNWDIDSGCVPLCVTFNDATGVAGVRAWSFGDGALADDLPGPAHCYTDAGTYDVTLSITTPEGCTGAFTAVNAIEALQAPVAAFSATPDVALIDDPTFQFLDRSSGATVWNWSFGDLLNTFSSERSPAFSYPAVACYTVSLEVANEGGCTDRTEAVVCVEDAFALYAPNAFTPNNDGINDGFLVRTTVVNPEFFRLEVFDRWGTLIHSTQDPLEPWDGDGLPQGIYQWQVKVRDTEQKMRTRNGHLALIR